MRPSSRLEHDLQIERDRRKEADLVRAGYRVLRASWLQLERDPDSVALMLHAALTAPVDPSRPYGGASA